MIFNINNSESLHELFILLTFNSKGKLRPLLANFLEMLTVLKGIKKGYIGPIEYINLDNVNQIKDLITQDQYKINNFVYYPRMNMIVESKLAKDLKLRGFKFMGSTICYAYMQAVGLIDEHQRGCLRAK